MPKSPIDPAANSAVRNALFRTASPRSDALVAGAGLAVSETAGEPAPRTAPTAIDGADDLSHIAEPLRGLAEPLASLQPAPDNARRHAADDLAALAESLHRFGQTKPVIGKRQYRGRSNVVLCGNGALAASRQLGWHFLAVVWLADDVTDDEARRLALVDNRSAEWSRWDATALASLQADGVDLLSLWHGDADLGALLGQDAPVPTFTETEHRHRLDQLAACPTCGRPR